MTARESGLAKSADDGDDDDGATSHCPTYDGHRNPKSVTALSLSLSLSVTAISISEGGTVHAADRKTAKEDDETTLEAEDSEDARGGQRRSKKSATSYFLSLPLSRDREPSRTRIFG